MRIIRDLHQAKLGRETVLTIGAFDGLHLGHQQLLRQLIRRARETERISAVLTFDPLPRTVLDPASNAICLTTTDDKIEVLEQWGLDVLVILPFTRELALTSARSFVQMLCDHLHMSELWVGWNFALGRGRTGNVSALTRLGRDMGFQLQVIEPVRDGEVVISSTQIRNLIAAGRVREVAEMLGRYQQLRGFVVPGKGRGKQLGFPTANLQVAEHCAVPASGVYAAYATIRSKRYPAAVNIGFRPTFGAGERNVEVHLLDFDGDLYGEEMGVQFVERLRTERRFPDADALRVQIEKDVTRAREILCDASL
jgi:riboflavin kinase/FMN adenylyltransferase